jgi:Golgi apparatus protein 1
MFMAGRASDVRKDLPLISACAGDLHSLCGATRLGEGRVMSCLKRNKAKLSARCTSLVSDRQREAAEDVSLDPPLANACKTDVQTICVNVGWGDGAKLACLQEHEANVTNACRKQLFRNEVRSQPTQLFPSASHALSCGCAGIAC